MTIFTIALLYDFQVEDKRLEKTVLIRTGGHLKCKIQCQQKKEKTDSKGKGQRVGIK